MTAERSAYLMQLCVVLGNLTRMICEHADLLLCMKVANSCVSIFRKCDDAWYTPVFAWVFACCPNTFAASTLGFQCKSKFLIVDKDGQRRFLRFRSDGSGHGEVLVARGPRRASLEPLAGKGSSPDRNRWHTCRDTPRRCLRGRRWVFHGRG